MSTQRLKEDQNFWDFIFSVFFIIVLAAAVYYIYLATGSFPTSVPLFDAVLMALAAFRITRLIVYDKIARWFRELFAESKEVERDGIIYIEVSTLPSGFRHTVYDLLNCPWCIGIWGGLVVAFVYFVFAWGWLVVYFLALAGAASLIQVVANSIGWRAETLKLEAKERDRDLRL